MKELIREKILEVEKMKKQLEKTQLSIVYDFFKESSLKSIDIDMEHEYNDEGGSYSIFNITSINGHWLEESISDGFLSDFGNDLPDWFCSFCLENNIKQTDIEIFCELFFEFLPEELQSTISFNSLTAEKLKAMIDRN
jgi:hypothetical protein